MNIFLCKANSKSADSFTKIINIEQKNMKTNSKFCLVAKKVRQYHQQNLKQGRIFIFSHPVKSTSETKISNPIHKSL